MFLTSLSFYHECLHSCCEMHIMQRMIFLCAFLQSCGASALIFQRTEAYEELTSRFELYSQIKEGMDDIATGNTRPFSEAMADIRSRRSR